MAVRRAVSLPVEVTALRVTKNNAREAAAFIVGFGSFAYEPGFWLVNAPERTTQIYTDDEFRRGFRLEEE